MKVAAARFCALPVGTQSEVIVSKLRGIPTECREAMLVERLPPTAKEQIMAMGFDSYSKLDLPIDEVSAIVVEHEAASAHIGVFAAFAGL